MDVIQPTPPPREAKPPVPSQAYAAAAQIAAGGGPRATWQDINPATASALLQRNKNRALKPALVDRYAGEMTRGVWIAGGTDGIAIDTDGFLRNGQHRLWAVIKSGTTQRFLVVRGVDPKAFGAMDIGATRQPGDLLGIAADETGDRALGAGLSGGDQKDAAAAVRLLERFENRPNFPVTGTWNVRDRMSGNEIAAAFTGRWAPRLVAALPQIKRLKTAGILGGGGVWGAMLVLMRAVSEEDTEEFVTQVATGANLSEGSPTLALRNRLLRGNAAPGNARILGRATSAYAERTNMYARSIGYAWNAFREGRSIARLSVNMDRPFPYPK